MNSMVKKELLKGAVISMPAFTKKNYELDIDRFKSHVSWLIDEGLIEGKAVLSPEASPERQKRSLRARNDGS